MEISTAGAPAGPSVKSPVRQPGDSNSMWSVEELLAYLRASYETFRTWRKHGRGPARKYRVGDLLRFAEEDVADWVASGCGARPTRREQPDVNAAFGW